MTFMTNCQEEGGINKIFTHLEIFNKQTNTDSIFPTLCPRENGRVINAPFQGFNPSGRLSTPVSFLILKSFKFDRKKYYKKRKIQNSTRKQGKMPSGVYNCEEVLEDGEQVGEKSTIRDMHAGRTCKEHRARDSQGGHMLGGGGVLEVRLG